MEFGYPSGGNYWSDYLGTDSNNDGIGDTPYPITGGSSVDRYPLMMPWGTASPVADCGADKLGCENAGTKVQFNTTGSYDPDGTILSYDWEFGDGATATGVAPNHTYAAYRWNGLAYQPFIVNLYGNR